MASIRTALTQSFATAYFRLGLQVVALVILARLLGPEEIGIYTIAAVFTSLAQELRNFAVSHYIVQEPELTPQRQRAAFTVNLTFGFGMACALYLVAPYAGDFYDEPGVTAVLSLLAANFLLTPFGTQVLAHFRRDMQFGKVMIVETGATVAHTLTSITLALLGLSYMALAWAAISGTLTSLTLALLMRPAGIPWLPGLREIRRVFSFGVYMTGSTLMQRVAIDLPNLIIGKTLGLSAVGLLSRSASLIRIFQRLVISGARPVMVPYLSAKRRAGEDLGASYLYTVSCMTGLAWPFFISLGLLADPVVRLLLGDMWHEVITLLTIWVWAPLIRFTTPLEQDLFVAAGAVKRFFGLQTFMVGTHVIIVAIAAFQGLEVLIASFTISQAIQRVIIIPAIYRLIDIDARRHWRAMTPSLQVAVATGIAVVTASWLTDIADAPAVIELGAGGLAALLGWLIGCRLARHPLMNEITRAVTALRQRRAVG